MLAFCRTSLLVLLFLAAAPAEDAWVAVPLAELKITAGAWPTAPDGDAGDDWRHYDDLAARQPFATLPGSGEAYIAGADADGDGDAATPIRAWDAVRQATLVMRVPAGQPVAGRLFVPTPGWAGMVALGFSTPAPAAGDQTAARTAFERARSAQYRRLLAQGAAGAAWFRHRDAEARLALGTAAGADPAARSGARDPDRELDDTFELFSGSRAVGENLQLDRILPPGIATGEAVAVADLTGITVAAMDWTPLLAGKQPRIDALAATIPADQHALLFPSFAAMTAAIDEVDAHGTALGRVLGARAEDALSRQRYQRQLCLEMSELARRFGPQVVASIAMTGSDPYLRAGSDVAVLFAATQPQLLRAFLAAKLAAAGDGDATVTQGSGTTGALAWTSATNPARSVCAYLTSIGDTVVVTNSPAQLERLAAVVAGTAPALASAPEYRFFRDRYALGEPETALLVATDAALRRWCGPRWRIADSRRTRAAALLAELQSAHIDALVAGSKPAPPATGPAAAGLGELSWTPQGIRSSVYGTLAFMTPIAELDVTRASKAEADAYQRFRDSYQRNWRTYFDPIAARCVRSDHGLGLDLSVMPLIEASDYQQFIEVIGKAVVAAGAGDPHQGAVLHWVMAIDKDSPRVQEAGTMASRMVPGLKIDLLGWLGQSLAVYADADPVWAELLAHQDDASTWAEKNFQRLPVALQVEVGNPLKLTLFLTALHGFVEQSAPGLSVWENRTWHEHPYVHVGMSAEGRQQAGPEAPDMGLYFAATPRALILTLNEALLQRALDRQDARAGAPAAKAPAPPWPWLGTSMDLHVDEGGMALLHGLSRRLQEREGILRNQSWSNLPILNVWHRLFPDEDPVAAHERLWGVRLTCPAGGRYVWNAIDLTMESTACGHPGAPKSAGTAPDLLADIAAANFGLTFADHGLRARVELERAVQPAVPAPGAAKP